MRAILCLFLLSFSVLSDDSSNFSMCVADRFMDEFGLKIYDINNIPEYDKTLYEIKANSSVEIGTFSIIPKKKKILLSDLASISIKKRTPIVYTREEALLMIKRSQGALTEKELEYLTTQQPPTAEILITLKDSAKTKLEKLTEENLKRPLVILVNNKIVVSGMIFEVLKDGKILLTNGDYEKANKWVTEFNKDFKVENAEKVQPKKTVEKNVVETQWIQDLEKLNKLLDERIILNKEYKNEHAKNAETLRLAKEIQPIEVRYGQAWIDLLQEARKSKNIKLKIELLRVELLSEIQGSLYDMEYAETVEELTAAKKTLEEWKRKFKELVK